MKQIRDLFKTAPLTKPDRKAPGFMYRYMSIAKFIDLVDRQELFLCKSTQLPDRAEGLKKLSARKPHRGFWRNSEDRMILMQSR
jgi:hypothetical protein